MPDIEYIKDSDVDGEMDAKIRTLLTTCFLKPQDIVFKERRYFREPPAHRWFMRDAGGNLIAHIAVHDKKIISNGRTFRIGGIAEVCVHPDHRGKGYVRLLLTAIHQWLAEHGFDFAVLFGRTELYSSSGYVRKENLVHDEKSETGEAIRKKHPPMIKSLAGIPWPEDEVYLPGPGF